jgi:ribonuclease D
VERGRSVEPPPAEDVQRVDADPADAPVIALAESLLRARALEAGLAYELVATRADLGAIVAAARNGGGEADVRTLRGWRRDLAGAELLELLAGHRSVRVAPGQGVEISS